MPTIQAQDNKVPEYTGKVSGKIYSDFSYSLSQTDGTTAFELERAYFGYERQLSEHFFANVKLDIGSPDDISEFSKVRRYAYFKNAGLKYVNGNITVWGGLFDMMQFKVQENFWGYRYLFKSFMDEYKIGASADIGAGIQYTMKENLITDFVISNGEGYSSPQRDETYKAGWGVTYLPGNRITLRSYYAIFIEENPQMTFSGFAGYDVGNYRFGGEYNHQINYLFNRDRSRFGYSIYGTYVLNDSWEFFLRYDQLFSNLITNSNIPWNLPNDGSALIGGIQFSPIKKVHLTLDYQDWVEYAENGEKEQILSVFACLL
jgi:hypothetical protein